MSCRVGLCKVGQKIKMYGAMRQDQYNVGLQNLDTLAIFVSIAPDMT